MLIYNLVSLSGALQAAALSQEPGHSVIFGLFPAGSQHLSRDTRSDCSSRLLCPHPSVKQGQGSL